jgi:hypothetical protein
MVNVGRFSVYSREAILKQYKIGQGWLVTVCTGDYRKAIHVKRAPAKIPDSRNINGIEFWSW